MKVVFISNNGRHKKITIKLWWSVLVFSLLLFILIFNNVAINHHPEKITVTKNEAKLLGRFDAILSRLAVLDAQVLRLNTLGTHIAENTKIDIRSFILEKAPATGGISESTKYHESEIISEEDLLKSIAEIEKKLADHKIKFDSFQNKQIIEKQVSTKSLAAGLISHISYSSPVRKGYVSSDFGTRRDPINGHRRHHNGIDIAAKHGSRIHVIASGFVTFTGKKGGYGNVVEVHHSNSLKSRYAHLNSIKVKKGQVVRIGDTIATMGKTGRATGSHLHLEVWKDNRVVDPNTYTDGVITNNLVH